jgi:multidrug efflux pump subunit AcrA (membrane-fusion protein)
VDVDTAAVEVGVVEERVPAYASVVAPWANHGFATARLPGRVVRVAVAPGQVVAAGDTLAEVESLELDALQAEALAAQNSVAVAEKLLAGLTASADVVPAQALTDARDAGGAGPQRARPARARWLGLGLPAARFDELTRRGSALPGLALPVDAPGVGHGRPRRPHHRQGGRAGRGARRGGRFLVRVGAAGGARKGPAA